MSVTIPTVYIYNIKKSITIISNIQDDVKDKWIGDYSHGLEKNNIEYIKRQLKL